MISLQLEHPGGGGGQTSGPFGSSLKDTDRILREINHRKT